MIAAEQKDQIEIRRMGQGLPAQPAQRQNRQRAAGNFSVRLFKFRDGCVGQHLDRGFGHPGIAR